MTGLPPSKISRYLAGRLEPSISTFNLLMSSLGMRVDFEVSPVVMERTKRRSWLLHRRISYKLGRIGLDEAGWERMQRNLERVRLNSQGPINERYMDHWQRLIDNRNLHELHRVLVDTSDEGVGMREVSPMTGFLTEAERLSVLAEVQR